MPFEVTYPADEAQRREGEAFYSLTRYTLTGADRDFSFDIRSFKVLPPTDAVALLDGRDETGLIVWAGALALLEWLLLREPCRLDAALHFSSASNDGAAHRLLVLELGCGSGVLAVALHKLLRSAHCRLHPSPGVLVDMVATDGNEECVALCARNLQEQCDGGGETQPISARAARLLWGSDGDPALVDEVAKADRLLVVSADVIYDVEAVPLLLATVEDLSRAFSLPRRRTPAVAPASDTFSMEWWLLYTPRSLTKASNIVIYTALTEVLAIHTTWQVEQLPIPPGCLDSGFPSASEADNEGTTDPFALAGCIFVVRMA